MTTEQYQKPKFTNSDICRFAQAFDVLLEGAIQNRFVDEHGKLATSKTATSAEKVPEGGDDD